MKQNLVRWLVGSLFFLFPGLAEANTVYFPQVVTGDGYSTTFTLINTDSIPLTGRLRVFNQDGSSRATPIQWESISIPPVGSTRFTLPDRDKLVVGSAYFETAASVSGTATFERRSNEGSLQNFVSVLGTSASSRLLLPVEISSAGSTGVALMNATAAATSLRFQLISENGSIVSSNTDPGLNYLGGHSQIAEFVTDLFPLLRLTEFKGTLIIEATSFTTEIAATGLAVKEGLFAGIPVITSFATPGITIALAGTPPSSLTFQDETISVPNSWEFALNPGVYKVSGEVSGTVMIALAGFGPFTEFTAGLVADSIKNVQGPSAQISPCFIVYTSSSGTQPFSFQFTVSAGNPRPCKNGFENNPLIGPSSLNDPDRLNRPNYDPRAVTLSGRSVVVAGSSRINGGENLVVRAYDITSGELQWTDQAPAYDGVNTWVFSTSTGETAFVAGYKASTPCCSDIFVRAYNSANGRVLWTDVWNKGRDDLPKGIAANSTAVVVVGYGGNAASLPTTALDFLVRAFQPATGAVLWEDRVNKDLLADDVAWAVTIDGARVFVAGTTVTPEGQSDLVLRAYDLTTGLLFWESSRVDMFPPINLFVTNGRLFVSGANYLLPVDMASGNIATADIE